MAARKDATTRRYGVYLHHFGPNTSPELLLDGARAAERYGFDSVWVRDHLIYHPHEQDPQDLTHIEPLTVLATVGAVTKRLTLGTGALIPHRNPIYLAIQLAALSYILGDRLILGVGLGNFEHEFEAAGLGGLDRKELLREQVGILRALWTGENVSHSGAQYAFADVRVLPRPRAPIPIWNCGNSAAAARRAVEYCEGFLPARISVTTFAARMRRMRRLAGAAGTAVPVGGTVSLTSPAATVEDGLRHVNFHGILGEANHYLELGQYPAPPSGTFKTYGDLDGIVLCGPPDHIVEQVERFHAAGASHFVFDLRFRAEQWLECVQLLGEEVLPRLRAGAAAA